MSTSPPSAPGLPGRIRRNSYGNISTQLMTNGGRLMWRRRDSSHLYFVARICCFVASVASPVKSRKALQIVTSPGVRASRDGCLTYRCPGGVISFPVSRRIWPRPTRLPKAAFVPGKSSSWWKDGDFHCNFTRSSQFSKICCLTNRLRGEFGFVFFTFITFFLAS